ncbi:hypothetical protein [Floridanema evergladense]|uniref:Uncharacterized protein n=1 Tax=Floridaenema evergladense BLCC-F167 TaxID=3153639 RepID=A0ABV4WCV9_9CYAN
MTGVSLPDRKQFLLNLDTFHNTHYRVWAGGIPVIQSNGSMPKIKQLPYEKIALIPGLDDTTTAWEVRIVKSGELAPLIRADRTWAISFDGGATQQICRVVPPIREHNNPELAWIVTLRK